MNICKMRIKNVEAWIERSIRSVEVIFDKILIFDDYSTDKTAEICKSFNKVIFFKNPFENRYDGMRDQCYLLQKALEYNPRWVMTLDGDEELTEYTKNQLSKIMNDLSFLPTTIIIKLIYYWNSESQIRIDGIYDRIFFARMFRVDNSKDNEIETIDWQNKTGCHAATIPISNFKRIDYNPMPPLAIKHYGYITKDLRLEKYNAYRKRDPDNPFEDNYQHIVIGDLLPADTKTKHAGPLTLVGAKEREG